jgi:hypothetical protein
MVCDEDLIVYLVAFYSKSTRLSLSLFAVNMIPTSHRAVSHGGMYGHYPHLSSWLRRAVSVKATRRVERDAEFFGNYGQVSQQHENVSQWYEKLILVWKNKHGMKMTSMNEVKKYENRSFGYEMRFLGMKWVSSYQIVDLGVDFIPNGYEKVGFFFSLMKI